MFRCLGFHYTTIPPPSPTHPSSLLLPPVVAVYPPSVVVRSAVDDWPDWRHSRHFEDRWTARACPEMGLLLVGFHGWIFVSWETGTQWTPRFNGTVWRLHCLYLPIDSKTSLKQRPKTTRYFQDSQTFHITRLRVTTIICWPAFTTTNIVNSAWVQSSSIIVSLSPHIAQNHLKLIVSSITLHKI